MTLKQWKESGEVYGTDTEDGLKKWLNSIEINKYWTPTQKGKNILLTFERGQYWKFGDQARYKNDSYIQSDGLDSLDEIRENILKAGNTQYNVTVGTNKYFTDILGFNDNTLNLREAGCGLILKTYQSDIFNNWIKTEWVDGENGISAITAISTAGDKFTIDQLNLSKKVYDMLNRIAVSGGTYQDWVETVYTSGWEMHTETPMYEGGLSTEIEFQEVVSNSASGEQPLGTLAGRGYDTGKQKGGHVKIKVTEPSFIMGIGSITPRIDYSQGNEFYNEFLTLDDIHKPALDGIGYQDLVTGKLAWWDDFYLNGTSQLLSQYSAGKQPEWLDYMTNTNKIHGEFAIATSEQFMVLDRNYELEEGLAARNQSIIQDLTTYVSPNKYNYVFADTEINSQNFWVQIGVNMISRRKMSAKIIPNL